MIRGAARHSYVPPQVRSNISQGHYRNHSFDCINASRFAVNETMRRVFVAAQDSLCCYHLDTKKHVWTHSPKGTLWDSPIRLFGNSLVTVSYSKLGDRYNLSVTDQIEGVPIGLWGHSLFSNHFPVFTLLEGTNHLLVRGENCIFKYTLEGEEIGAIPAVPVPPEGLVAFEAMSNRVFTVHRNFLELHGLRKGEGLNKALLGRMNAHAAIIENMENGQFNIHLAGAGGPHYMRCTTNFKEGLEAIYAEKLGYVGHLAPLEHQLNFLHLDIFKNGRVESIASIGGIKFFSGSNGKTIARTAKFQGDLAGDEPLHLSTYGSLLFGAGVRTLRIWDIDKNVVRHLTKKLYDGPIRQVEYVQGKLLVSDGVKLHVHDYNY